MTPPAEPPSETAHRRDDDDVKLIRECCKALLGGVTMCVRFLANLILGIVVSSPTRADMIRLHCSETLYDKALNKSYDIPQVFILQDFSTLRWDNQKVDLSVVTTTPETIEATGKATAYMPLPSQIDQCVNAELASHPTDKDANGTVNKYLVVDCVKRAEISGTEVPRRHCDNQPFNGRTNNTAATGRQ
jgi:hypothetical protein